MGGFDVIASPNDLPRSDLQYVFASGSFVFVRGISYSTDIGPMIGSPFGMRYSLDGGLSFSNPPLVDDNSFSLPFANDGTNLYYINLRAGRIEVFHSSGFGDSLYHIALPSQFDASSIFADQKYIYAISGSKLVTITKNPLSPNQYLSETREITGLPSYFQHQGGMSSFVVVEGKLFGGCVNGPSGYCSKLYYTNLKDPSASYSSVAIGSGVTKILDIYSSDDYVFIATNNGLYRTSRTLGPSAVPVISPSTSLPQPYVYTVFSKGSSVYVGAGAGADDVSPATAGLYVSTDQGANWTGLMNTNLPSPHINKIHVDGTYIYFATKQGLARGKLLQ